MITIPQKIIDNIGTCGSLSLRNKEKRIAQKYATTTIQKGSAEINPIKKPANIEKI
jgi:hypothetical protein